jgi:hypothetical protein
MAQLGARPLTEEQRSRLSEALFLWAESHPRRNDPLIAFADGGALSPMQIAVEVRQRTLNGEAFVRMVQCGLEVESFERIVAGFARSDFRRL